MSPDGQSLMTMPRAQELLREVFGFDGFRTGQREVIDHVLAGRPVLAVMPTGAGKSLCYQLPALVSDRRSIVVSPLTALMDDQVIALEGLGVAAVRIHSGRQRHENVAAWRAFAAGETRLLYLSPERLMTGAMIDSLKGLEIGMFVVDEAHCISKWGVSFRPEYEQLGQLQHHFPEAVITGFTATADAATRRDISMKLTAGRAEILVQGFDRPNLLLAVQAKLNWKSQLLDFLRRHQGENGIIYCLSRKQTEETETFLSAEGVSALAYHAGMAAEDRRARQNRFMSEDGLVMVATIAFGMGIDKPDIRFVVHTDMPGSMEAFYQEIGRAGRDGLPAETMLLYGLEDMAKRRRFIDEDGENTEHKLREHKRLDALIAYCEAAECRRQAMLRYFDEETEACGNCDNCLDPPEMVDGTREAQMLLSAMARTGNMFGQAHVIDVLYGAMTQKIQQRGHDRLKTFGVGQDHPRPWWRVFVRQMLAAGHVRIDIERYGRLETMASGLAILKGEAGFRHRQIVLGQAAPKARARATPADSGMTAAEAALFARLKARRLEIARERNAPAYTILTDAVLRQLAVETPRTEEAFAELNGVGPAKTRDWAETFLAIVNEEEGEGEVFDGGVDAESYGDDVDVNAYMDGFDDA